MTDQRAFTWVRILGVALLVAIVAAGVEAAALRSARHELQQLRDERASAKGGVADAWARQSAQEFTSAVDWLHAFYADPAEGFGRAGGLCPNGRIDAAPIAAWVLGPYLHARAAGRPYGAAVGAMQDEIVKTEAWRALHPVK